MHRALFAQDRLGAFFCGKKIVKIAKKTIDKAVKIVYNILLLSAAMAQ